MYYKEDWGKAKQRLELFWKQGEIIDRCCVAVFAPRKTSKLPPFPELQWGPWLGGLDSLEGQEKIRHWWLDPDANYQRMQLWFENTYFGGEAVPCTYVNWGAMAMAAFYGSPPVFAKNTVWYPEVIRDWESWQWRFEGATNELWRQMLAIVRQLVSCAEGRYFVGAPELGTAGDLLSLMRGMDNLCMDLIDHPAEVKAAIERMATTWVDLHEQLFQMTCPVNDSGGVLAWMSLWAPGRISQIACDYSTVISPSQFAEFFVPEIVKESEWCDYATYHLDGPAAMRSHLETLLNLESVDAVEWTPGAGNPPTYSPEYIPQYRKIQSAGKKLYLLAEPKEIEPLLREISPKGLFLCTHADSEAEADGLLERIVRWCR